VVVCGLWCCSSRVFVYVPCYVTHRRFIIQSGHERTRIGNGSESGFGSLRGAPWNISHYLQRAVDVAHGAIGELAFIRYCHYHCMVPGARETGRGGTIHCAILFVGTIHGSEIKEVFRANYRID